MHRFYRALQHLFIPFDLSAGHKTRRVCGSCCGKTRIQANHLRRARYDSRREQRGSCAQHSCRNRSRRYIVIKREVSEHTATTLREKLSAGNLRGIYFEHDATRIYPNGSMLCHVIGFTDFDHHGIQGVEASMEEYLHGQDGYRFIEHNRAGQEIVPYQGQERAPRDGYQIHLTVDLGLQNIVENEIDAAMQEYSPQKATIILMRPQTGEILAMANRPHFDLNLRSEAKPEQMKNRAIIDMMEPGSTFKIVVAASALNERKLRLDSQLFCENGVWNYGGSVLHDHRSFSYLSVRDILIKSSNIGAAKLAMSIGDQKFYEYIRRFGFGERTRSEERRVGIE